MAMDDLLRALDSFNSGLQSLQTSRVINNANEMVAQIRQSDLDAKEKRNQLNALAQDLTFKLVGLGGSVQGAQQLASTFMPSEPEARMFNTPDQAILYGMQTGDEMALTAGLSLKELEMEHELEKQKQITKRQFGLQEERRAGQVEDRELRQERAMGKEIRATLAKTQQEYNRASKDIREATRFARQGLDIINSNGAAAKMIGAVQFAAARAAGSSSQLSDKEREALAGRQDLLSQFQQLVSTKAKSEFIEKNKEAFRDLFEVYARSGEEYLDDLSSTFVNQLKTNPLFVDEDDMILREKITGRKQAPAKSPMEQLQNMGPKQPDVSPKAPSTPTWFKPR